MDVNTFNTEENAAPPPQNSRKRGSIPKGRKAEHARALSGAAAAMGGVKDRELWFVYKARGELALVFLKNIWPWSLSCGGRMMGGLAGTKDSW